MLGGAGPCRLHADARPCGLAEQQEKNEAEKFKQQAAITRSTTAQQVAEIENQAWLVNRKAQAEADKIRALAQVRRCKRALAYTIASDPVPRGLLTLCPWASSGLQGLYIQPIYRLYTSYIQPM